MNIIPEHILLYANSIAQLYKADVPLNEVLEEIDGIAEEVKMRSEHIDFLKDVAYIFYR